ncbi:guanylate kinase [Patescibacteria group bacterium]|nr:guanylate kinase [Patescibacteria group bacterium]
MSTTGKFILILGPSGSGKGTVLSYLKKKHPEFIFPISCTTRSKRPNEADGEVYNFINKEFFEKKKDEGDFLEWALVHNKHYYGTLKKPILDAMQQGKTVIREVDVQGLQSIRKIISENQLISIFLTVKNWETLKERILERSPMSEEELARRKKSFKLEMAWQRECDYVVESVTGKVDEVCRSIENIILSQVGV